MRLTRVDIADFRLLGEVSIRASHEGGSTTILVGTNNSGKTSVIEALQPGLFAPWA
ncbi:MAG: AAA family ATPase [Deltaproteobacteria bacterium]|nr:AAA family ATPase [Deltaproteobacteria bacterium]